MLVTCVHHNKIKYVKHINTRDVYIASYLKSYGYVLLANLLNSIYSHLHSMHISLLALWRQDIECFSKIKHTISRWWNTLTKPAPRIYLWCRVVFWAWCNKSVWDILKKKSVYGKFKGNKNTHEVCCIYV